MQTRVLFVGWNYGSGLRPGKEVEEDIANRITKLGEGWYVYSAHTCHINLGISGNEIVTTIIARKD